MSDMAPEPTVTDDTQGPQDTGVDNSTQEQAPEQESRAPWSDFVEKFPASYRGIAEEAAKEWDAGVTKRFQDLHSTYEPYKPFIEEWEPDAIGQAIQLAQALESDPQAFYQALAQSYGFAESEQGVANQQQELAQPEYDENDPYAPQLQQHEELLRTLADHIIGQEEAKRQAEESRINNEMLDTALNTLKQQYGEYDENYVLQAIAAGQDPEDAVKAFRGMVDQWAAKQNAPAANAPRVMRGSGGLPSLQVDPAQLGNKETKNLVAEYLRSAQGG